MRDNHLGKELGSLVSRSSYEWCLTHDLSLLIQYKDGNQRSYYPRVSPGAYTTVPLTTTDEQQPFHVATVTSAIQPPMHYLINSTRPIESHPPPSPSSMSISPVFLPTPDSQQQQFLSLLDSLHPSLRNNIGELESLENLQIIAIYLSQNQVIAVGDASV